MPIQASRPNDDWVRASVERVLEESWQDSFKKSAEALGWLTALLVPLGGALMSLQRFDATTLSWMVTGDITVGVLAFAGLEFDRARRGAKLLRDVYLQYHNAARGFDARLAEAWQERDLAKRRNDQLEATAAILTTTQRLFADVPQPPLQAVPRRPAPRQLDDRNDTPQERENE